MDNRVAKFEGMFRQATPLFLLCMLLAVVFEPWLPYRGWYREQFGDDIVLRVAVMFLIGYTLLLWGETLRLHGLLTGVLQAFKAFDREQTGGAGDDGKGASPRQPRGANNPKARIEAARLLIAAMRSDDDSIRETSHHNLVRLVGKDLGTDPDVWQKWLSQADGK